MTRRRFEKLTRAMSEQIGKKVGFRVTGDMLRKQRELNAKSYRERFGSYQAAWDSMKDIRDTFGFQ